MTVQSAILSRTRSRAVALSAAALACALLVGFSALVRIPIPGTPVPVTLQTFALLACAGVLGRWYALQMMWWYLALGLVGAPFFAGGDGWQHVTGATGGYLVGFVAAAAIVGFVHPRRWYAGALTYLAAAIAIYVPGVAWLKVVTGVAWPQAVAMGVAPFIVADIVKALAAWIGVRAVKR